ncbi:MAG: diphosphate--fructose-6-phosphate 1-phosphotransferase [Deltaproteobacteria bacterium]|nr:MAG: diphosphate--fructose-6-phosphate 1-phosphotransferase [Deltaproteobacteria bacterium]
MPTPTIDTAIDTLGVPKIDTPLTFGPFIPPGKTIVIHIGPDIMEEAQTEQLLLPFAEAGPCQTVYFDPPKTKCALVTCGGLCPGLNDVIRSIVMEAHHHYHVAATIGIRYGLQGFIPRYGHDVLELTPETVTSVHEFGGTILSSSRGPQSPDEIVDALERMNINILFMIGGDGTMQAARRISQTITQRRLKIAVIGIPKTIDNDIHFVPKSFGFDSAVAKATESIRCAHVEAQGAPNGIGIVKLMGRESGFIAAEASLALKDVNFVLIPEAPFELQGDNGLLKALENRLRQRQHAVIVVAEGAGQHLCATNQEKDASGNPLLGDICQILRMEIQEYFHAREIPVALKYIDPSYIIRSIPANAHDRVYCGFLGQHAVHAGMAGKTNMVVTRLQDRYVYLPLDLVTQKRRKLNTQSMYWRAVLESTGQPLFLNQHAATTPQ